MLGSGELSEEAQVAAKAPVRIKECSILGSGGLRRSIWIQAGPHQWESSHFAHPDVPELINLQDVKGKAKPYQIKQLLQTIEAYNLRMEEDEG